MKFFHLASIPHVVNVRCASGGFVCDSVSVMFTQPNRESARVLAFAQQVRVEKRIWSNSQRPAAMFRGVGLTEILVATALLAHSQTNKFAHPDC
jgi:hypothetical protein